MISEHLGDTYLLLDEKQRALEKFEEAICVWSPGTGSSPTSSRSSRPSAASCNSGRALRDPGRRAALRDGLPDGLRPRFRCRQTIPGPRRSLGAVGATPRGERHALRGRARLAVDGGDGAVRLRGKQIVVLERPARLRVEVLGFLNQTVAVLTTDGERFELFRSGDRSYETGAVHPDLLWQEAHLALTPEEADRGAARGSGARRRPRARARRRGAARG